MLFDMWCMLDKGEYSMTHEEIVLLYILLEKFGLYDKYIDYLTKEKDTA